MYIPVLKAQHENINRLIDHLIANWQQGLLSKCSADLKELSTQLHQHHELEREVLFEKLRDLPKMNQGGPLCSYFFEFFMHNRPLVVVERMISEVLKRKVRLVVPDRYNVFFDSNSLLTIPLEEHIATELLCDELALLLEADSTRHHQWISEALPVLKDMISTNHNKEENCLWIAAQNAMDPAIYGELGKLEDLTRAG